MCFNTGVFKQTIKKAFHAFSAFSGKFNIFTGLCIHLVFETVLKKFHKTS